MLSFSLKPSIIKKEFFVFRQQIKKDEEEEERF